MKNILLKLISKLNKDTILLPNPKTGLKEPYLTRHYLIGKKGIFGYNLFIHQFHSGDMEENELHNHPFKFSLSFILSGGYFEELKHGTKINVKERKPFTFNLITPTTYHRVNLRQDDCWTIFLVAPRNKNNDWYFWNSQTNEYKHWTKSENAIA